MIFYGDKGSLDTDGESYRICDLDGKLLREEKTPAGKEDSGVQGRNTASPTLTMDSDHIANFLYCIRNNSKPNCDVESGYKSVLAMQLGNISWRTGRDLHLDPVNGHILQDPEAQKFWRRNYQPGWEPVV